MCNSEYLHSHTRGGNFCALKFWSTLRPLIAWLLLLFVVFLIGGGERGVGAEGAKEEKSKQNLGGRRYRNKHKYCEVEPQQAAMCSRS